MLPRTRNVADWPSITPRNGGHVRRIKFRSSAGTVTLSCRKSPIVNRNPFAGSCTEKNCDPVFGELSDLRETKEFRCVARSPDYYAVLQRNFSVHNFWLELAEEFQDEISNVQEVAVDIPDLHSDFIKRVKVEDDLSKACEEIQDFEQKSFNKGRTDSFSSCNSPDLDYLEDQVIEFPFLLREPDCKIVHRLTGLDAGNVISTPLISNQNPDHIDSDSLSGEKMHKYLTSTRSKKRTRLNPAIARGSFSANFLGDLQFKSVNDLMLLKKSSNDNLECNEVLSDSNSEDDSDVEFVQIAQKEGRLSKPKRKRMKKTAATAKRSKVLRGPLPRESVNVLREWMERNIDSPFATKDEKLELQELSGLTLHQVENWLSNTRYKMKNRKSRAVTSEDLIPSDLPIRKELTARNKRKLFTW